MVSRGALHPMRHYEQCVYADKYLTMAEKVFELGEDGHWGWLYLLAAHDLCVTDAHTLSTLVENYLASSYGDLAADELRHLEGRLEAMERGASKREAAALAKQRQLARDLLGRVLSTSDAQELRKHKSTWTEGDEEAARSFAEAAASLPQAQFSAPFSTLFGQWRMDDEEWGGLDELHAGFNEACLRGYELMKRDAPEGLSDTELNHHFFRWQMAFLRDTGAYWKGFADLPLFRKLEAAMKAAAAQLLQMHGMDAAAAWRKANHRTILWASVHTGRSIHEPHMTKDSLVGGVYYSGIPEGSGQLALFDPRGLSPHLVANHTGAFYEAVPEGERAPRPPFHRTVSVTPEEGKLVLFPGWLVHQVLPSAADMGGYRISISVNLKGEWQDTGALMLDPLSAEDLVGAP